MSRAIVQVELRDTRSTSFDCSAVKRSAAESGEYLTLVASPKTAAATARQRSMSSPDHLPASSTTAKPGRPLLLAPHCTKPLALTASKVSPANAAPAVIVERVSRVPTASRLENRMNALLFIVILGAMQATGQSSMRPLGCTYARVIARRPHGANGKEARAGRSCTIPPVAHDRRCYRAFWLHAIARSGIEPGDPACMTPRC